MTNTDSNSNNKNKPSSSSATSASKRDMLVHLSYLSLALTLIVPLFSIFAIIVSFDTINKNTDLRHKKHYKWMMRSLLIFVIINIPTIISYSTTGMSWLTMIFIFLLTIAVTAWYIIRLMKGWLRHFDSKEPSNAESWLW